MRKSPILIVEFARDLKESGMSTTDAAIEATRRRFRPILMTSIAFILGGIPLLTASGAGAARPGRSTAPVRLRIEIDRETPQHQCDHNSRQRHRDGENHHRRIGPAFVLRRQYE